MNKDQDKINSINQKLDTLYQNTKFRIIFLLSGPSYLSKENMWKELHKGLIDVSKLNLDCQIIFRLRDASHKNHPYIKSIIELTKNDSRFIEDQLNFTTQELLLISDLVITPNSSFAINESLAIDKCVYTFDVLGNTSFLFEGYGNNLIINSAAKLVKVFEGLENEFNELKYNRDLLANDLNYYTDGMNCRRISEIVLSLSKT